MYIRFKKKKFKTCSWRSIGTHFMAPRLDFTFMTALIYQFSKRKFANKNKQYEERQCFRRRQRLEDLNTDDVYSIAWRHLSSGWSNVPLQSVRTWNNNTVHRTILSKYLFSSGKCNSLKNKSLPMNKRGGILFQGW